MRFGFGEILVILVVVVLIFGASKIPQLGDALGKGIRNFKKATGGDDAIDVTPSKTDPGQIAGAQRTAGQPEKAPAESKKS